jgi:hypothetical protein
MLLSMSFQLQRFQALDFLLACVGLRDDHHAVLASEVNGHINWIVDIGLVTLIDRFKLLQFLLGWCDWLSLHLHLFDLRELSISFDFLCLDLGAGDCLSRSLFCWLLLGFFLLI